MDLGSLPSGVQVNINIYSVSILHWFKKRNNGTFFCCLIGIRGPTAWSEMNFHSHCFPLRLKLQILRLCANPLLTTNLLVFHFLPLPSPAFPHFLSSHSIVTSSAICPSFMWCACVRAHQHAMPPSICVSVLRVRPHCPFFSSLPSQKPLRFPPVAPPAVQKTEPAPQRLSAANGGAGVGLSWHVSGWWPRQHDQSHLARHGGGEGGRGGWGGWSTNSVGHMWKRYLRVFFPWNGFDLMDKFDLSSRPQSVAEVEKHCRGYYWRPNSLFWLVTSCFTGIEMSGSLKKNPTKLSEWFQINADTASRLMTVQLVFS